MIVTLRGKLERTTKPGDANAAALWRWSGSWAFGRAVEMPSTKSGSSGATSSKQNPLPFLYTFERPEDPSRVAVPSLQKPVDPLMVAEEDDAPPSTQRAPPGENEVISDQGEVEANEAVPGEAMQVSASTESSQKIESNASESVQSPAQASHGVKPSASLSSTAAATDAAPPQAKFISFADKLIPDWPDFTDAATKYKDMVPPSGLWKGYFETALSGGSKKDKQHPATTMQVPEECVLFLNSTPPKSARVSFEDTAANLLLAPGHIHVRGRGENQYGVFELLGSLNAESGDLVIQRKYIVHPTPSSGPGRPRIRRTRDSQQAPNESGDGGRPYFTRKRPMSWKKRAAMEDEQESASPDASSGGKGMKRGRSASVGPGCDVGKRARLDSETSHSMGGVPLSRGMAATSSLGTLPRLSVTIPGAIGPASSAVAGLAPPGSVSTLLPIGPASATSAGSGLVGASGVPPVAYHGTKQPQTTALLTAAAASLATKPGGKNASKVSNTNVRSSAAAAAAAALSSSSGASSTSSHLKLPTVGDPHKARWRAAHFLYYHRNDGEDGGGSTPAKSPTAAGASSVASGAASNKDAGSSGPKFVIYEGEMLNSHREGQGICLYSSGLLYEGQWRRDKEQGTGKLMTSDRKFVIYEGEWERGKMHGRGVYYYGDFRNRSSKSSAKDGKTESSSNPASFSVPRYDGEFKENLRHGTGTYYLSDGSAYVGNWQNNVMSGRGVFTWPDGSVYDGDWKDGKRHGQGILRASDGFSYDGNWSQNSMEGRGSATYPNGQQYIGLFTAGRREGRGTMLFTNGATYEGRFRDDAVDGQGTLRLSRSLVVPRSEDEDEDDENAEGKPDNDAEDDQEDDDKPDFMIPISFQSDIGNIHRKAGFTLGGE